MKTLIKIILLLSVSAFINACKESEEESKPIPNYYRRDRFVGTYLVSDDTGAVYTLTISKFNSGNVQYLHFDNLANKFDISSQFYNEWVNPDSLINNRNNKLMLGFGGPIKDKKGYTWDISTGGEDSSTAYEENYLYGNVIVLYFRLSNLPYYDHEGVPFHMQLHKHIATKIN